jgi:hypothetical protein
MHFVEANIFYGQAYLLVNNNEVWRVWIGDRGTPLIGRLTDLQKSEWENAHRVDGDAK